MADNIYNNFYGGSYQSGDGVVATLLGIIATQKGTIDSLQVQVQDVRAALEGNFDELSDRVANIQETVDKNHKYEIKKFSEMKGLLANLLEKEDANSATLKEMAESIARLEANNGQREENNRLAEETNRLTEENNRLIEENNRLTAENNRLTEAQKRATEESNRRIEALERQLSRLENAFVSATTAGNQQQQQSAGKDDNEVERLDPVFVRGVSAPEHEEIEVRGEDDTSKPDPNPKPEPEPRPVPDPVPEPVPDPVPEPVPEPVPDPVPEPVPDPVPEPVPEPKPDPVPEPVPEPKPVPEPVSTKNKLKIKLLKKSMDGVRMLAEPKLPWYKRMFNFANRHPVLTTLVGAGIGTALTFLSGPAAFLMAPSMTLTNFIGNYIYVLAGGAVMGLGGGIAASAVSGLVMKGKKGRLYGKFVKQYKKCKSIEMSNERLDSIIDLSQSRAQEMHEKAKEARGPFRGIKKFVNRKLRDANLKVGKIGRVYRQRGQEKYNNQVDSALKTKIRLNELEAKPNRRGKTKSLAIAGYFEKKKRLDSLLERGKITADEYAVRMEDLETDVSQLEGGEPGISSISDKHRTYDKEAWELIESVKGKESDTMRYVRNDISGRHSKVEEVIKDFINPEEAEHDAQALEAEGRANEAKLIRMQVEEQRKEMEKSREISDKYPIVFQEEIITDAEAEETQDDEKTSE